MFIGAVSSRRDSQTLSHFGLETVSGGAMDKVRVGFVQFRSSLQLPLFRAHKGNVKQPSTKGDQHCSCLFLDLTVIFEPVLHVILSGFCLAQRMVAGCFSSHVLGVKGIWSTGSERGRG